MVKPRILLVNPPIYDFTAYDFWLKPFGLLRIGGFFSESAELSFYDFLDRSKTKSPIDAYGRGKYREEVIPRPKELEGIRRRYKRFGHPRGDFESFLKQRELDFVLISTSMTYWYPGVKEVIETVKKHHPLVKIVLGGIYATLLREHAYGLGADLVVEGNNTKSLFDYLYVDETHSEPLWDFYSRLDYGVIKLSDGCPFKCTYCASKSLYNGFRPLSIEDAMHELRYFVSRGVRNVVFYDDALLYKHDDLLYPFLDKVQEEFSDYFNFHTPNALNARYLSKETAAKMVEAGFKTFYLGFESSSRDWQNKTGGKVSNSELSFAVKNLLHFGIRKGDITIYVMLGHPEQDPGEVMETIKFVKGLGVRIMLSEYSPVPKTQDFEMALEKIGLPADEPLYQNKTAYPIFLWGEEKVNNLKMLAKNKSDDLAL